MKNWQTTIAGLGCIVDCRGLFAGAEKVHEGVALIAAGLGLIRAKDSTTHSTAAEVGQASADAKQKDLDAANGK